MEGLGDLPGFKMREFITVRRNGDAVVSVLQDNTLKALSILSLNGAAEGLLGYTEQELISQPLRNILESKVCSQIDDYLEYDEEGTDLFDIFSKVRGFCLLGKRGNQIHVSTKTYRVGSESRNKINYELLIRDVSVSYNLGLFRAGFTSNYTLEKSLGILDEPSSRMEFGIVTEFCKINNLQGIVCVVGIDGLSSEEALQTVNNVLHKNIRSDDIVGYLGDNKILLILMKCKIEDAKNVVSRAHNVLKENLLTRDLPTASIAYSPILEGSSLHDIENSLKNHQGGNQIELVKLSRKSA